MDAASAIVVHRMNRLFDLPEDVFEQILLFLTFKEKAIARRVCKSWFRVVHYLLKQQRSVMLRLSKTQACSKEDSGWIFETCGHSIGRGFSVTFTHDRPHYRSGDDRIPCPVMKAAVRGFCDAVTFVIKHCNNIRIADLSCGCTSRHSLPVAFEQCYATYITNLEVLAACARFVTKFQHQLKCLHYPTMTVTPDNRFPHLMHLTCRKISPEIRNIFSEIAPKLRALDFGRISLSAPDQERMHIENYEHLPETMCSIALPYFLLPEDKSAFRFVQHTDRVLQPCRYIRTITTSCTGFSVKDGRHYANLRSLQSGGMKHWDVPWEKTNILCVIGSRLQRLVIYYAEDDLLPEYLMFSNLQSLIVHNSRLTPAMDLLSRTTDNLTQLCLGVVDAAERAPVLLTEMSKLNSLTFFSLRYENNPNYKEEYDVEQVEGATLRLLRGGSRSSLKFVWLGITEFWSEGCSNPEICAEVDRMKEEESLNAAIFSNFGITYYWN